MKKLIITLALAGIFLANHHPAQAVAHSPGQNVLGSDGTIYFITQANQKRPYTSAGAFLSYGLNSIAGTLPATAEDMALTTGVFIPPQDGKIICSDRGNDKGTCYLISQSARVAFPSAEVFLGQGFSFKNAETGDVSFLTLLSTIQSASEAHSPGVLINDNGTIFLVGPEGLMGIPTENTFKSWGYAYKDVVPANTADKQKPKSGIMPTQKSGQLSPLNINPKSNTNSLNSAPQTPYETQGPLYTPRGAVTLSTDTNSPATQKVIMDTKDVLLYTLNLQETSGMEGAKLKGLKIRAKILGGTTLNNLITNSAYYTLKNFTLTSGTTTLVRPTWSSETPPRPGGVSGSGEQTYLIDYFTNSPLNLTVASSSTITLNLKAEVNPWLMEASANSVWSFFIASPDDVTVSGENSRMNLVPSILNQALSSTTTIIKQPVTFSSVASFNKNGLYATASSKGTPTTLEIMGIFKPKSLSGTNMRLLEISLQQSGSALPTGTTSPVTYYVYDGSHSLSQPVGIGVLDGSTTSKIKLNLNSAIMSGGVIAPADGEGYLIISADTSNFTQCTLNCTGETYSYNLKLTAWEWIDENLYNQTSTGPFTGDTGKDAIFSNNKASRAY